MVSQKQQPSLLPWFIWGLAAFFFFAHYVVRVTPGQIVQELQAHFQNTSMEDIGILGASFYLPYAIMQMPVGYLVDKFGSRLLLASALLICCISSLIFANADTFNSAILSRVLFGFCAASAFIGALKLITVWFEPQKLALLVGITQALGMVGSAAGNGLVPYIKDNFGWQNTYFGYAIMFFSLSILVWFVVRDKSKNPHSSSIESIKTEHYSSSLSKVLLNKYTWINALYAGFIFAPTDTLGELWGREFLWHIHNIEPNAASFSVSLLLIGWAIGGPIAGSLADHFGRKTIMKASALMGLILLPIIFYVPNLPFPLIMALMFLYGFTNTGLIASYASAGELHSNENAGFSMAIANMFSILIGAALMPVLGKLVDYGTSINLVTGAVERTAQDYKLATLVLPACLGLALIFSFFVKETLPPSKREKAF